MCVDCAFTLTSVGQLMCAECARVHRGLPAPPPASRKRRFDLGFLEEDSENVDTGSPSGARGRAHSGKDMRAQPLTTAAAAGAPTLAAAAGPPTFAAAAAPPFAAPGACAWQQHQQPPAQWPAALAAWPQQPAAQCPAPAPIAGNGMAPGAAVGGFAAGASSGWPAAGTEVSMDAA